MLSITHKTSGLATSLWSIACPSWLQTKQFTGKGWIDNALGLLVTPSWMSNSLISDLVIIPNSLAISTQADVMWHSPHVLDFENVKAY